MFNYQGPEHFKEIFDDNKLKQAKAGHIRPVIADDFLARFISSYDEFKTNKNKSPNILEENKKLSGVDRCQT